MEFVKSFRDLDVYKLSRQLSLEIFEESKQFPKEETYSFTDQIRRASRSIGAQIAEAWGKRRYPKHFISKLTDADGERYETEHWVESGADYGYITREKSTDWLKRYSSAGKMINSMINKSEQFCSSFK